MSGPKNGSNLHFTLPWGDKFAHNLPFLSIQVYFNGQRLRLMDDFLIRESGGPGSGYDTVIMEIAPRAADRLAADYVAFDAP